MEDMFEEGVVDRARGARRGDEAPSAPHVGDRLELEAVEPGEVAGTPVNNCELV